jgi:hypothetical protein
MRDPPLCHERFRMCGAGRTVFRILPSKPVSVHTAHRRQKRMEFRLLFPRGIWAETRDGGVEGINSVYSSLGGTR